MSVGTRFPIRTTPLASPGFLTASPGPTEHSRTFALDLSEWLAYLLSLVFSPADSDGPLCGVAPAQDEEPQACPDEFEDFVTFEASGFPGRAERGLAIAPHLLYTPRSASHSGPLGGLRRKMA